MITLPQQKFVNGQPIAGQVILYEHVNLEGQYTHIFNEMPDLRRVPLMVGMPSQQGPYVRPLGFRRRSQGDDPQAQDAARSWNDQVSSFVVLSGTWTFYRDPKYVRPYSLKFTRGVYNNVAEFQIPHDQISSLSSMR